MNRTGSESDRRLTRRGFLGLAAWGLAATGAACRGMRAGEGQEMFKVRSDGEGNSAREGRLLARPNGAKGEAADEPAANKSAARGSAVNKSAAKESGTKESAAGEAAGAGKTGEQRLGLDARRDALLYVPGGYAPARPAPLALMLHGAGGSAEHGLSLLRSVADESNLILLAPQSRAATWDVIGGDYGPDVSFIDRALAAVFARYSIDAARLAVGGFSDGASYALSLGVTNGDLFTHVLAYSPGFAAPAGRRGRPRFYLSHGTRDQVLPVERCSRRLVPQLRGEGYEVLYREFDGPHTVPAGVVRESADWFLK